jgi:hypothetical protein
MMSTWARHRRSKSFLGLLILAVAGPMCGGGGGGGGGGAPGGGGATFQVLAHTPVQGAVGIARTATIYVVVNGVVDPATLTSSTVTLMGVNPIPATFAWNLATSSIEIHPTTPMDQNATHTVNLLAGVKTVGGASLTPSSFSFTTVNSTDTGLPTFGGVTSITGAGTTSMTVNWTAGTDTVTPAGSLVYDVYLATASSQQNFGNAPVATSAAGATSVVLNLLTPNTTYFVVVRCRDTSQNQDANAAEQSKKTLVSFSTNIYAPIINNICVTCHTPGGISEFMVLSISASDVVTNKWVNINADGGAGPPQMCQASTLKRVLPGDPANSLVYLKISMTTPPCGVQMPEGLPPLSSAQIQLFFDWITQGALNN